MVFFFSNSDIKIKCFFHNQKPKFEKQFIMPANAGYTGDAVSIPGMGRSPGGGNDNPLQHSCLRNPLDSGAWWDMESQ